jgi:hypothetical protein
VKAIVQGSIGHTGIEPKAFFNAIDPEPTTRSERPMTLAAKFVNCSRFSVLDPF